MYRWGYFYWRKCWFCGTLIYVIFFSMLESFLFTEITLGTFSSVGKPPMENERINISANWLEISFFSNFNIVVGMLLGPADFWIDIFVSYFSNCCKIVMKDIWNFYLVCYLWWNHPLEGKFFGILEYIFLTVLRDLFPWAKYF